MIGEKYTLRVSKKDNGVKIFNNYDENNWRVLNVHYQNYEDAVYLQIKLKPLVDLLNELYKENEKLKKENNQLQRYVYHCPQFCKRILAYLGKCGNEDVEAVNNAMDIDEYFDEEIDNLRL